MYIAHTCIYCDSFSSQKRVILVTQLILQSLVSDISRFHSAVLLSIFFSNFVYLYARNVKVLRSQSLSRSLFPSKLFLRLGFLMSTSSSRVRVSILQWNVIASRIISYSQLMLTWDFTNYTLFNVSFQFCITHFRAANFRKNTRGYFRV